MSSQTGVRKEPLIRTVKRAELSKNRTFLLRIVALLLAIAAAVSYTHLDVYKRQIL